MLRNGMEMELVLWGADLDLKARANAREDLERSLVRRHSTNPQRLIEIETPYGPQVVELYADPISFPVQVSASAEPTAERPSR
jgi:hypothetical protein